MTDEDRYTRITLRIPRELHAALDQEADRTSKSLNAEIVARLQASFEPGAGGLPEELRSQAEQAAKRWGCTFEEAFDAILMAATNPGAPEVLMIYPAPGMTAADYGRMFDEGRKRISPIAPISLFPPRANSAEPAEPAKPSPAKKTATRRKTCP